MKALIVGGGVAGTVTAMALQQVGIEATIFEAHPPSDGELGSYFTVTANGLEALGAIGARELAIEAGFPTRRNVMWNEAGRRLASLPLDSSVPGSPAAHTMKRSRLTRILQEEAARRGVRIDYGRRLKTAVAVPDGVLATFDDGGTAAGDLLIGADGVHSAVRRIIDPAAPSGRYVGLTNFGGVTHGAANGIEPEAWHLVFGRRAFFGYQATPDGDVVWFANVPRPQITPEERASTSEASMAATARQSLRRGRRPGGRADRGRRARAGRRQHARPRPRPGLAPRSHGHHRRRSARSRPDVGSGRLDGHRGRDRPGRRAGTDGVDRGGVCRLRAAPPRACREDRRVGRTRQQRQGAGTIRADRSRRDAADPLPVGDHREVPRLDVRLPDRPRQCHVAPTPPHSRSRTARGIRRGPLLIPYGVMRSPLSGRTVVRQPEERRRAPRPTPPASAWRATGAACRRGGSRCQTRQRRSSRGS